MLVKLHLLDLLHHEKCTQLPSFSQLRYSTGFNRILEQTLQLQQYRFAMIALCIILPELKNPRES